MLKNAFSSKKYAISSIFITFEKNNNEMVKQKLIDERTKRSTQAEFAFRLGMDTSNYGRRENGLTKISKKEWDKMAKELNVKFEEIYDPEDGVYVIN